MNGDRGSRQQCEIEKKTVCVCVEEELCQVGRRFDGGGGGIGVLIMKEMVEVAASKYK